MFILFTDSFFCMIFVSNVCLYYSLKFDQIKKMFTYFCCLLRGPAILRGYFFIYRVLSMSLLSVIKCTMWNYMTPPSSPSPQKIPPTPPFMVKKKVFFSKIIFSYANYTG